MAFYFCSPARLLSASRRAAGRVGHGFPRDLLSSPADPHTWLGAGGREQREGSISTEGAGESKTKVQRQLLQALRPESVLAAVLLRRAGGSQREQDIPQRSLQGHSANLPHKKFSLISPVPGLAINWHSSFEWKC